MLIYRDGLTHYVEAPAKVYKNREGHTIERYQTDQGKLYFVTLKDSHYCAHGRTLAEAIADAKWKDPVQRPTMDALKEEIISKGKDTKITLNEFRVLTGACREGCKDALKQVGLEDVEALNAYDIRDLVSREWGNKLLDVLEWR